MHAGRLCRIYRKDKAWQKENALKGKGNGIVPLGYIEDSEHHFAIDEAYEPVVRELSRASRMPAELGAEGASPAGSSQKIRVPLLGTRIFFVTADELNFTKLRCTIFCFVAALLTSLAGTVQYALARRKKFSIYLSQTAEVDFLRTRTDLIHSSLGGSW